MTEPTGVNDTTGDDERSTAVERNREDRLSIVSPADVGAPTADRAGPVVGVLLAAGTSSRFGEENKLLARLEGTPLVRRAARTLRDSRVDRVVVVVGHEADRVREALWDLPVETVENDAYERGQATSVRTGVCAAREREAEAIVIALGDMPRVDPRTVDALVDAYRSESGDALAAAFEGRRGNPVLFGSRHFDALVDISGDTGGRRILLDGENAALVETGDPGVVRDVDTRDDLDDVR